MIMKVAFEKAATLGTRMEAEHGGSKAPDGRTLLGWDLLVG